MQIVLAADFFRKERQAYRRWRWALWRELFQNAIDQQASAITIRIEPHGDNGYRLYFHDNGPGMTRQVLETVYFAVGASSKTGQDGSIGGMGRARMLTCFSMAAWSIRSQDYEVTGSGGNYEIAERDFVSGCALTIDVDDCPASLGTDMLRLFLRESRITATVTLNGEPLTLSSGHLGRHIRYLQIADTAFASVYVNKSLSSNSVIVRVSGVAMFTTTCDAPGQVVVELLPNASRQALTSNRDGLHYDYARVLNAFITELSVNTGSATQSVRKRHTTIVEGGGALSTPRRRLPSARRPTRTEASPVRSGADSHSGVAALSLARLAAENAPTLTETDTTHDRNGTDLAGYLATNFGDIFLFDETENPAMRKKIALYHPQNWQERQIGGRIVRQGARTIKLLMVWKTLLDYAIELYLDLNDSYRCEWSVGFVFHDDHLADHREQRGRHIFALRPVHDDGSRAYSIQDRASLRRLMTLAKHEVTHIAYSWHNEAFSRAREKLDMVFDEAEAYRRIKSALADMREFD